MGSIFWEIPATARGRLPGLVRVFAEKPFDDPATGYEACVEFD